jgi:hypothetical protein
MSQQQDPAPVLNYSTKKHVLEYSSPAVVKQPMDPFARMIHTYSQAMVDIRAQLAWMNHRLSAVEARLGIVPPAPPVVHDPGDAHVISALEQMSARMENCEAESAGS